MEFLAGGALHKLMLSGCGPGCPGAVVPWLAARVLVGVASDTCIIDQSGSPVSHPPLLSLHHLKESHDLTPPNSFSNGGQCFTWASCLEREVIILAGIK